MTLKYRGIMDMVYVMVMDFMKDMVTIMVTDNMVNMARITNIVIIRNNLYFNIIIE
jgi:hypothetical protein